MTKINLLPGKKKAVAIPPAIIYGVIALVLVIAGTVIFTFYLNGRVSAMQADVFAKEKRLNELKAALKQVENYERDNQEFREKAMIIEQLKKNQIVPLRILDEVSSMLPRGVWLTNLTDRGGAVSIQGYAFSNPDLVTFVQNLKRSKYLKNVSLVESRQSDIDEISVYKFNLTLNVKV